MRSARVWTLAGVVAALVVTFVGPALGHAAYSDSDPTDEATVSSPPGEVWAEFTEPPADGSTLKIFDECGRQVDNGDSRLEAFRIYITMSSSTSGTYRVAFRVLSAYDNHVTTGDFTFDSTGGESCAGEQEVDSGDDGDGKSNDKDGTGSDGGSGNGSGSDGTAGATDGSGSGGSGDRGDGGGSGGAGNDEGRSDDAAAGGDDGGIDLARDRERPEKGLMEGIEWGEFAFALAIAALIGAAGGKVYAEIGRAHV